MAYYSLPVGADPVDESVVVKVMLGTEGELGARFFESSHESVAAPIVVVPLLGHHLEQEPLQLCDGG